MPRRVHRALADAQDIFQEFRHKELKPTYIADADSNRALLGFGQAI